MRHRVRRTRSDDGPHGHLFRSSGVTAARAFAAAMLVVLAIGCGAPKQVTNPPPEVAALYPTLGENPRPPMQPYVLQVGDELAIKFYTNPELNEDVKIRPDGMISLQLIDDVPAAGRTPAELDADLTKRYTGELADPQISVIVRTAALNRVYVDGQVGKPGTVVLAGGMTLYQALQEAGGLLEGAHRKQIILIRKGADGKPVGRSVDIRPIQDGWNPSVDVPLLPLDIVYVPRSKIAEVDLFVKQYIRDALPITYFPVAF